FSRSIIPYIRGKVWTEWLESTTFYTHVGIYAYRAEVLSELTKLPQSSLEKAESLEQLRWLQNGYKIKVGVTEAPTIGIDTPEDLENAKKYLEENGL
ncbi:MAG: 3-deoxy-manno-octulosonate cytidylyltransferase, partial [Muribaculaceae bacterium]|nr:3-deoxy-manno-octulosonate cytidylyltransferase [Muribaculaceae bacterium]